MVKHEKEIIAAREAQAEARESIRLARPATSGSESMQVDAEDHEWERMKAKWEADQGRELGAVYRRALAATYESHTLRARQFAPGRALYGCLPSCCYGSLLEDSWCLAGCQPYPCGSHSWRCQIAGRCCALPLGAGAAWSTAYTASHPVWWQHGSDRGGHHFVRQVDGCQEISPAALWGPCESQGRDGGCGCPDGGKCHHPGRRPRRAGTCCFEEHRQSRAWSDGVTLRQRQLAPQLARAALLRETRPWDLPCLVLAGPGCLQSLDARLVQGWGLSCLLPLSVDGQGADPYAALEPAFVQSSSEVPAPAFCGGFCHPSRTAANYLLAQSSSADLVPPWVLERLVSCPRLFRALVLADACCLSLRDYCLSGFLAFGSSVLPGCGPDGPFGLVPPFPVRVGLGLGPPTPEFVPGCKRLGAGSERGRGTSVALGYPPIPATKALLREGFLPDGKGCCLYFPIVGERPRFAMLSLHRAHAPKPPFAAGWGCARKRHIGRSGVLAIPTCSFPAGSPSWPSPSRCSGFWFCRRLRAPPRSELHAVAWKHRV